MSPYCILFEPFPYRDISYKNVYHHWCRSFTDPIKHQVYITMIYVRSRVQNMGGLLATYVIVSSPQL
jgi:hypothetical protein